MSSDGARPRRRTRPTREETRVRLLEGAARVFTAKGIGATTIEDICDEAGFSRGAFYSNFKAKGGLVLALIDHHFDTNQAEVERLFAEADSPAAFLAAMDSDDRRESLPVDDPGMLHIELILHAMRDPKNRPMLVERQRRTHEIMVDFLTRIGEIEGIEMFGDLDDAAALLAAFDSGLLLHGLIDPERHDPNRWSRTALTLHGLWVGAAKGSVGGESKG